MAYSRKKHSGTSTFSRYRKSFDTVEWPFPEKTLQRYNFGPSAMNWIRLFYHNTESCIINNGWSCAFFKLQIGVRQGCPLSPYLSIVCVEILAELKQSGKTKTLRALQLMNKKLKSANTRMTLPSF